MDVDKSKAFMIGKYPITQKQWELVMGQDKNNSFFRGENLPVENVSWYDAILFCNQLSKKEGLQEYYIVEENNVNINENTNGFRLPTEAEWEYAASGGNRTKGYKCSGSNNPDKVAWYYSNALEQTHEVGTKNMNELGIYDMSGNVWEWCEDYYDRDFYAKSPSSSPLSKEGEENVRIIRGGSWMSVAWRCRVSRRDCKPPTEKYKSIGFRVARSV